jgi:hypothetical protein
MSSDSEIYIKTIKTDSELGGFTVTGSGATSLITPNTTKAGYDVSQTSFVVGSDRLDDDSSAVSTKDKRMLFDKATGAFRAGTAESTQWDSSNRGTNSAALGLDNIASGANSFAAGKNNTSTGYNSITLGLTNNANNPTAGVVAIAIGNTNTVAAGSSDSIAIGRGNVTSTGNNAMLIGLTNTSGATHNRLYAFGSNNNVTGANSFAIGYGDDDEGTKNTASGTGSITIGYKNTVSTGANGVAIGNTCTSTGDNSFAIGQICNASANNGVAIGQYCTASGLNSVAIGNGSSAKPNTASGNGSFAIGKECNTNGVTGAICMGTGANIDTSSGNIGTSCFFWNGDVDNGGTVAPHKYANSHSTDDGGSTGGGICFWGGRSGEFRIGFGNSVANASYSSHTDSDLLGSHMLLTMIYKAGSTGWDAPSDINKKENLVEQNYSDTLTKIMEMPVYTYNYKTYSPEQKNIGPVAQDFNRLFPSNSDPLMINSGSLAGVTLASVKGVKLELDSLSTSVDSRFASNSETTSALQSRITVLESSLTSALAQIAALESRLAALETP